MSTIQTQILSGWSDFLMSLMSQYMILGSMVSMGQVDEITDKSVTVRFPSHLPMYTKEATRARELVESKMNDFFDTDLRLTITG